MSTNFFENPFAHLAHVLDNKHGSKDAKQKKHRLSSSAVIEDTQDSSFSTSKNSPQIKDASSCHAQQNDAGSTYQRGHPNRHPHSHLDMHDDTDNDECSLFLRTMSQMYARAHAKEHKPSAAAFRLMDHIPLWQTPPMRKKHKKKPLCAHKKDYLSQASPLSNEVTGHALKVNTHDDPSSASFKQLFLKNEQSDDADVFLQATKDVVPLSGGGREVVPAGVCGTLEGNARLNHDEDFRRLLEGEIEFSLALKLELHGGEYLEGHVLGLDPLIMENLRAGNYSPEAHIDLHGLNAMQAYRALLDFFRRSWYKGLRAVLVVPGRGKNSVNGFAVLRDKLQLWLTQDPFKRVVLAFCTAQAIDGGPGSVYVLLRKYKKKGKIHWERIPADADLF